ncbi:MAG: restriction endonuclease subunit S [Myxococcus sp.]|nr:restriction endonuclease subunit S [Myxococcus sp.]
MSSSRTWPLRQLKDCAVWYSGGTPNKSRAEYWGGSIPWISARSITNFYITDSEDRVSEAGARNGTRMVPADSILFIVRGMSLKSEFRMGITTQPVTFNQDLKALVAVDGVLPSFLAYAIKARSAEILGMVGEAGHGTGVLPTDRIQSLAVGIPSLAEQRVVADILRSLDDKIELNRQMNETLEAMARALFKSWFVDFDPVHAKAAGRAPMGMDAETAKLFPSEFVDSALGPIPNGWQRACVGDCTELKRGTTYKGPLVGKPGPALLGLGSIRPGGGFREDGFKTYGGECPDELMLRPGEMYVSLKGATKDGEMIGSVARLPSSVPLGRLTQDTVKLVLRNTQVAKFLYRLLLTPEYRAYCAGRATGSAVVGLSRDDFLSYPLVLPPPNLLACFSSILAPLEQRAELCSVESRSLATTRDALLPRLLSGELKVAA